MPDPLFFVPLPHADLHAVLTGPQLKLDVQMASRSDPAQKRYDITSVFNKTVGSQTFTAEVRFLAQHKEPPNRFTGVPTVDPNTGLVTVTETGVFLFQVRVNRTLGGQTDPIGSVVGRLQVHDQIVDWWFGNRSITTAKDDIPHAQPTIYARFSPDQKGTDVVGDITGHDFVPLVSSDTTKVVVDFGGRLRGVVETAAPVTLTGSFGTKTDNLPVRVVDYVRARNNELTMVRVANPKDILGRSNLVFVAEGFLDTPEDRALFTGAVRQATERMFTMPRHDPFGMLSSRFNVFQLFAPSQERGFTTGFPVSDKDTTRTNAGLPIPYQGIFKQIPTTRRLAELIGLIGLAKRNETRSPSDLRTHWKKVRPELTQLDDFPDQLIEEWKGHRAEAFLDAVDTRFGMYLGARFADGDPRSTLQVSVSPPAVDDPAANTPAGQQMRAFVARLYSFYTPRGQVEVAPDPRRHPPRVFGFNNLTNPGLSIMSYLAGQTLTRPFGSGPNLAVGKEWVPDDTFPLPKPTPSRGLVVFVAYEDIRGGMALNNSTAVGVTMASNGRVVIGAPNTIQPERLTRFIQDPPPLTPPNQRQPLGLVNLDFFTNVTTHELGHVYALGDEYESLVTAVPDEATFQAEFKLDNIARVGRLGNPIDPDRVKWFALPRMRLASRLTLSAKPAGGTIEVRVDPADIPKWADIFKQATPVSLRKVTSDPVRQQLPLKPKDVREFQDNLLIIRQPNPKTGAIVLTYPTALPNPVPEFPAGSALYVPQLLPGADPALLKPLVVVDQQVLTVLKTTRRPLNHRPNNQVGVFDPEDPDPNAALPKLPANSFRTVGLYEGANHASLGFYRPTGSCKMRNSEDNDARSAFCFVCRWLLVNAVDPGQHVILDSWYPGGQHG